MAMPKSSPRSKETVILVMTDMDDDDFEIIIDNIEFKESMLFVCDREYSTPEKRSCLKILIDDMRNPDSLLRKLEKWARQESKKFSAVIGLDEEYRYRISEAIALEFGLKFYPRNTLDLCSNKYLQRVTLSNAGIGVPDFQLIEAGDKASAKARIGFPNVLKLMTGVGSAHLYLNRSQKELSSNLKKLIAGIKKDASNPLLRKYDAGKEMIDPGLRFLLEEFIGGNEYSCDYIIEEKNGRLRARVLRVVRKLDEKGDFGYFAGFCLYNPDNEKSHEFHIKGKAGLEELCTGIAKALGIRFGVCMLDFKLHKGKFYVIETTLRPGVATFVELMAKQYGHISLSLCIRQRLGLPAAEPIPKSAGLVAYLNAPGKGVITHIDLSYILNNMGKLGIIKLHRYCGVGESHINVAYVLASASDLGDSVRKIGLIRKNAVIRKSR